MAEAEQLPIHYSTRVEPADPAAGEYEWRANGPAGERHAFPPVDGFRRSICSSRVAFTAAFGHHGASTCHGCIVALREQLRATSVALAAIGIRLDRADRPVAPETELERRAGWGDR